MNGAREPITRIYTLPANLTLHFKGVDGAPERKDLNPVLRYQNKEECLAKLKVIKYSAKEITLRLPENLVKHGLGRYEVCVHTHCCRECDCTLIEFCGDCEISKVSVTECEEECDVRA